MAAKRVAFTDPLGEASATFGFGLSRLLPVRLYAQSLAVTSGVTLPAALLRDRAGLSAWINKARAARPAGRFSNYPSAKQVQFAERIARLKRRQIPDECFRDRTMLSRWIDGNKPR